MCTQLIHVFGSSLTGCLSRAKARLRLVFLLVSCWTFGCHLQSSVHDNHQRTGHVRSQTTRGRGQSRSWNARVLHPVACRDHSGAFVSVLSVGRDSKVKLARPSYLVTMMSTSLRCRKPAILHAFSKKKIESKKYYFAHG